MPVAPKATLKARPRDILGHLFVVDVDLPFDSFWDGNEVHMLQRSSGGSVPNLLHRLFGTGLLACLTSQRVATLVSLC